jgi:hypothetical protein
VNVSGAAAAEIFARAGPERSVCQRQTEVRSSRITANHFMLIRSFLIESDGFLCLRATICAKIFITSSCAPRASLTQNTAINPRNLFSKLCGEPVTAVTKILISSYFLQS